MRRRAASRSAVLGEIRVSPVLLGALCISCSAVLVKLAGVGVGTAAAYRCALALPLIGAVAWVERTRERTAPLERPPFYAAYAAGVVFGANQIFWNETIRWLGAGPATVLGNFQFVFVGAIAWVVLRERPHARWFAAVPVALVGIVLLSGEVGMRANTGAVTGTAYGLATAATYAVFILLLRRAAVRGATARALFRATACAAVTAIVVAEPLHEVNLDVSGSAFMWLCILALLAQGVGWLLITGGLTDQEATTSSLQLLLQPVAAVLLAFVALGEHPSAVQIVGAVTIMAAVTIGTQRAPAMAAEANPSSVD